MGSYSVQITLRTDFPPLHSHTRTYIYPSSLSKGLQYNLKKKWGNGLSAFQKRQVMALARWPDPNAQKSGETGTYSPPSCQSQQKDPLPAEPTTSTETQADPVPLPLVTNQSQARTRAGASRRRPSKPLHPSSRPRPPAPAHSPTPPRAPGAVCAVPGEEVGEAAGPSSPGRRPRGALL